jgi:hypothetical protein
MMKLVALLKHPNTPKFVAKSESIDMPSVLDKKLENLQKPKQQLRMPPVLIEKKKPKVPQLKPAPVVSPIEQKIQDVLSKKLQQYADKTENKQEEPVKQAPQ